VNEYLIDLNATAAAARAGYKHPNQQGPRLLVNVGIAAAIQARRQALSKKLEITQERWLGELAFIGFFDPAELIDFTGKIPQLKQASQVSEAARRALASLEVRFEMLGEGQNKRLMAVPKVKFWDKLSALDKIGRHFGWLTDRHEHRHGGDPNNPTPIKHEALTDAQRAAGFLALLARVGQGSVGPPQPVGRDGAGPDPGRSDADDAPGGHEPGRLADGPLDL